MLSVPTTQCLHFPQFPESKLQKDPSAQDLDEEQDAVELQSTGVLSTVPVIKRRATSIAKSASDVSVTRSWSSLGQRRSQSSSPAAGSPNELHIPSSQDWHSAPDFRSKSQNSPTTHSLPLQSIASCAAMSEALEMLIKQIRQKRNMAPTKLQARPLGFAKHVQGLQIPERFSSPDPV
jgi:hypothetical protein